MTDSTLPVPRLIERKRDGGPLSAGQWRGLIEGYVVGSVPDYQMSALAMAIVFRGLEEDELVALTTAMLESGDRFHLEDFPWPRVDKHSIGGVGDKTSLLLAPMLACLEVAVPMISGRGLGHTGGTLDKLEAIPGFTTQLSLEAARRQLERLGCVMLGQTPELVPADRKLYALRDVTGTVESIPLISASIMSKKLAESLTGLVLDIKTGSGAFIQDPAQSLVLAQTMIRLGEARGCRTTALLTAMDRPLGVACGNAIEVAEVIEGLRGQGPSDLMEVTYALAAEMLLVADRVVGRPAARAAVERVVSSGAALDRFRQLVEAQGGDPRVVDDPSRLPQAPHRLDVVADTEGRVTAVLPRPVGHAVVALGGGRAKIDDAINPAVGVRIVVRPGDLVRRGDRLAIVEASTLESGTAAQAAIAAAIRFDAAPPPLPLVSHRVTSGGVEALAE